MRAIKVAAIQAVSRAETFVEKWNGVDLSHALDLLDQAAAQGAELACLPELFPLVGEPELCAKAREHDMHIVAGVAEGTSSRWRNTSLIISPEGRILGRQTKNYPTSIEIDNGVVPGTRFEVIETDIGRIGIVICADFAFFNDGVGASRSGKADIIFNPAVWFAIAQVYPHVVAGRHLEYSVPIFGVNQARRDDGRNDARFPPAGGCSTVCIPPKVANLDELWQWFRTKPGGIDSIADFVHIFGPDEEMRVFEVDIDAVRRFPGYFSTRESAYIHTAA
jgi:predicted amidohydrolase